MRRDHRAFIIELTILILAAFLGVEVISKVPTLLHTPLMSGTNAIHGIVIVGAIIVAGIPGQPTWLAGRSRSSRSRSARPTSSAASSSPTGCCEMFKKRKPEPAQAEKPE